MPLAAVAPAAGDRSGETVGEKAGGGRWLGAGAEPAGRKVSDLARLWDPSAVDRASSPEEANLSDAEGERGAASDAARARLRVGGGRGGPAGLRVAGGGAGGGAGVVSGRARERAPGARSVPGQRRRRAPGARPSPWPDPGPFAPEVPTVRALLERQAARLGSRPFVTMDGETWTYAEVDEAANRVANLLLARGHRPGDVVAALAGNGFALLATWWGCAKAGLVSLPVNALLRGAPLAAVLADAEVATVVCEAGLAGALSTVAASLPRLRRVLVATPPGSPGDAGALAARSELVVEAFEDAFETAGTAVPPALDDDPGAPTKLLYTSGTTGEPKGVQWSRACEATHAVAYGDELLPIAEGEALYCCLPLAHITCQGTTLAALRRGGRVTIDRRFDPFGFWPRVRDAEAVAFTYVGTLLSVLAQRQPHPAEAGSALRWILGSAAPADRWRGLEERFGVHIIETWGQTETASCWTAPAFLPQHPGTVGRPSPRFEARLVATAERAAGGGPEAEVGELWIRPKRPHVLFDGYRSRGRLVAEGWSEDGWYRTGDLFRWTDEGDLAFVVRVRESVRRRGELIATAEIERVALGLPGVAEAAAVGVPADDGVEEELLLAVVAAPGADLDPGELWAALRTRLPKFMVPRYVAVRAVLPKTPTTRVRKHLVAAAGTAQAFDARSGRVGGAGS